jgi:hypothetical protein
VILVKLAAGTSTCNKVMHDEKAAILSQGWPLDLSRRL